MDIVLSSTLRERFTPRHKQAWSFFFQQLVLDLGKGVEHQAAIDANCVQKSHVVSIGGV